MTPRLAFAFAFRRVVLIAIVGALAGMPLAVELCAADCVSGHHHAAAPPCHHSASPEARTGRTPSPCGHTHQLQAPRAGEITRAPLDALSSLPVSDRVQDAANTTTLATVATALHGPPPLLISLSLSPLRI